MLILLLFLFFGTMFLLTGGWTLQTFTFFYVLLNRLYAQNCETYVRLKLRQLSYFSLLANCVSRFPEKTDTESVY